MIPVCEPKLSGKELEYVTDCIKTNWISSKGKYITEFEEKFSKYCGAKYGIATCNGTTALHLALASLGIGPGDEIICPSFTMIATANSITYTGAKPVLVDSERDTWNIDPSKIEEKITDRTKAIMVMHTYGHPCAMDEIREIAEKHDLYVIEDAAEAHGAEYRGRRVGALGDAGCFSFYANKIVTSVCGNEPLIVMDDAGNVKVVEAQEFIDEFFKENEEGEVQIQGWYAPAFDEEKAVKWRSIRSVIRHSSPPKVYKVSLQKGRSVTVTGNHSIFVYEDGKIRCKKVSELKKGDLVGVPSHIPEPSLKVTSVDVLPLFLKHLNGNELEHLRVMLCLKDERLPPGKHYSSVSLSRLRDVNDLETYIFAKGQGVGGGSAKIRLPRSLPITKEMCRLLGYYVAEGCLTSRGLAICFTFGPDEQEVVQDCVMCAKRVFPDSSVSVLESGTKTTVTVNGKLIALLLDKLVGRKAKNKILPSFMYNISRDLQLEFLDAYVKGDGCFHQVGGSDRIEIKTVSKKLATGLYYLLLMLGFPTTLYIQDGGERNFGKYVSKTAKVYQLSISGIKGRNVKDVELTHKNLEEVYRIGDVSFLPVVEIEEVSPPTRYVYDLSCPPHENFIGGFGAIFLHNTGEGGMVVTNDEEIARMCRLLRDQAFEPKRFIHRYIGFNYRMTNLQAAIGVAQMGIIDESVETRRRNARLYNSLLKDVRGITLPPEAPWAKNVYWMYTVLVENSFGMDRDKLMAYLKEKGIDTRSAFYPIHIQPVYAKQYKGEKYPVAEKLGRKGVNLPSGNTLTKDQIRFIVETIASAKG